MVSLCILLFPDILHCFFKDFPVHFCRIQYLHLVIIYGTDRILEETGYFIGVIYSKTDKCIDAQFSIHCLAAISGSWRDSPGICFPKVVELIEPRREETNKCIVEIIIESL